MSETPVGLTLPTALLRPLPCQLRLASKHRHHSVPTLKQGALSAHFGLLGVTPSRISPLLCLNFQTKMKAGWKRGGEKGMRDTEPRLSPMLLPPPGGAP